MKLSMASNVEHYQLVDANVWIAYFNEADPQSTKAKQYIFQLEDSNDRILVTDFVIQETVTILFYKNQPKSAEQFLNYIRERDNIEIVSIDSDLWNTTFKYIQESKFKPKLSFTDWSLLFLAGEFNFNLLTFDKQLANVYKRLMEVNGVDRHSVAA